MLVETAGGFIEIGVGVGCGGGGLMWQSGGLHSPEPEPPVVFPQPARATEPSIETVTTKAARGRDRMGRCYRS